MWILNFGTLWETANNIQCCPEIWAYLHVLRIFLIYWVEKVLLPKYQDFTRFTSFKAQSSFSRLKQSFEAMWFSQEIDFWLLASGSKSSSESWDKPCTSFVGHIWAPLILFWFNLAFVLTTAFGLLIFPCVFIAESNWWRHN